MLQTLPTITDHARELERRMQGPQRHRLLHGYPLAGAMRPRREVSDREVSFDPRSGRGLLVGVLPHPFCNPAVAGCGFCTFPHQKYGGDQVRAVMSAVCQEIDGKVRQQRELLGRPVAGLYFGGGTANLSPPESFRTLCRTLARAFDLRQAEVTLEGVPIYFLKHQPSLLDVMREELPARHFRISMGLQTFDEEQLRRMGRLAFGTASTFRAVVEAAHERGFTVSADLLFNLPHQTLGGMQDDVRQAVDLGLDHLGLYHLVLFRGLGTTWSRDPAMLAALPSNADAEQHWLTLRQQVLDAGFEQTTLTNFERNSFRDDDRRFLYEAASFQPHRFEMLGFGPSAISFAADAGFRSGLKVLNPDDAGAYLDALGKGGSVWDRYYHYNARDLRIFHLTRRLAALEINVPEYRGLFGTDPLRDFSAEFQTAADEGLLEIADASIRPTPRGMFYADSIAALWASRRFHPLAIEQRSADSEPDRRNDNGRGYM